MLVALVTLGGFLLPPGRALERWSYDLPFALRSARAVNDVLVVYLDDISHQQLFQPIDAPWDRRLHAQLLTNLFAWGARAVAFDIVFDQPATDSGADETFAQALAAHRGQVVLAALLDHSHPPLRRLIQPQGRFLEATGDAWGLANLLADADGAIRRHFHADPEWKDAASLAWRVTEQCGAGTTRHAATLTQSRWLNYYGPPGTLSHASYFDALNTTNRSLAERCRDRFIFVGEGKVVGYTGAMQEAFRTPYSRFDFAHMPGVDMHATQFLNLLHRDWLTRLPPRWETLLLLALATAFGAGLALARPWVALGLGLAGSLGVAATGCALAWAAGLWFPWAVVSLVTLPAAAICALAFRAEQAATLARRDETTDFGRAGEPASAAPSTPHVPDHELLRRIGRGSYGEVWLARSVMGTLRAVKILQRQRFGEDRQFDREFAGLQNFEPVSRLHDGFVDILHVGKDPSGAYFYYVMELADNAASTAGPARGAPDTVERVSDKATAISEAIRYEASTLQHEIQRRTLVPFSQCLQVGLALSAALDFLHRRGLVHRDLKPSNIVFVNGLPKLADIGLVAGMEDADSLVGTMGYIPPEGSGTPAADLFSLGKVLYEIGSGLPRERFPEWPEDGSGTDEVTTSGRLHRLILKACEPEVSRRYASAQAMHQDLLRVVAADALRR